MERPAVSDQWKAAILLALIVAYSFFIHWDAWSEYPEGIHAWAQADQVALVDGFRENGYDLFHPQTYVFNHQFPNDWRTADNTRITAVDFPLYQWISAMMADLFHLSSADATRIITFLLSVLGIVFLYRSIARWQKSSAWALLACCFFASLPLFSYYQLRFLPSVPALSLFFCGWYYYVKFRDTGTLRSIAVSVVFLTLAALIRTTYLIPLLSVFGVELIGLFRNKNRVPAKVMIALASLGVCGALLWWNTYLRLSYGSLFLSELMPAVSWPHLLEILSDARHRWLQDYFTLAHYALLALVVFAGIRKKVWRGNQQSLFGVFCLLVAGSTVFFFAMARQFPFHDYYFIDTFYPSVAVLFLMVNPLTLFRNAIFRKIAVAGFAGFLVVLNGFRQEARTADLVLDISRQTNTAFRGSEQLLTAHGIGNTAKVLVLPCHSPNLPFLQLKRAGFAGLHTDSVNVERYLRFPADVVVIENGPFFREIVPVNRNIFRKLKPVAGNGRITICRRVNDTLANEATFLEAVFRRPLAEYGLLKNAGSFSDKSGFPTASTHEFGVVLSLSGAALPVGATCLRTEVSIDEFNAGQVLVISVSDKEQTLVYQAIPLKEKLQVVSSLPPDRSAAAEIKVYLYNPGRHSFRVNDLKVAVY